ncbi:MAG: hypothetical protein AAFZ01_13885 [Pseudomonadota bacterium]
MSLTFPTFSRRVALGIAAPALAFGLSAATPVSAAGVALGAAPLGTVTNDVSSNVIQVQRRGSRFRRNRVRNRQFHNRRAHAYRSHRRRARRRNRRNLAIGLGVGILGAAILADRHRNRHYRAPARAYHGPATYRAAKRKCARIYGEDYSWRSDLVYNAYGEGRVCKFVRRFVY